MATLQVVGGSSTLENGDSVLQEDNTQKKLLSDDKPKKLPGWPVGRWFRRDKQNEDSPSQEEEKMITGPPRHVVHECGTSNICNCQMVTSIQLAMKRKSVSQNRQKQVFWRLFSPVPGSELDCYDLNAKWADFRNRRGVEPKNDEKQAIIKKSGGVVAVAARKASVALTGTTMVSIG